MSAELHMQIHFVKHKTDGYLSGFDDDDPIFDKNIKNAIALSVDDAVDIAESIGGISISTLRRFPIRSQKLTIHKSTGNIRMNTEKNANPQASYTIEIDQELENRIKKMAKLQEQLEKECEENINTKDTYDQLKEIESSIAMTICSTYRSDKIHEHLKKIAKLRENGYSTENDWEKAKEIFLDSLVDIA